MTRSDSPDLPRDVVDRALDGERVAFDEFYQRYDPTVRWAVGARIGRWPKLAPRIDDLVQDVWCELTRDKGKRLRYHDTGRGVPFRKFLALVVARLAWRIAKRELEHPEVLGEEEAVDDGDFVMRMMHANELERLRQLVEERLDEKDRRLFEDHYVKGDKLKDVGARMEMNENATYKRNERLQHKLRRLAEELLGERPHDEPPQSVAVTLAALFALASGNPSGSAASMDASGSGARNGEPGVEVEHA